MKPAAVLVPHPSRRFTPQHFCSDKRVQELFEDALADFDCTCTPGELFNIAKEQWGLTACWDAAVRLH